MKISGLHIEVDAARVAWRSTRYPGVSWLPLHPIPELGGAAGDTTVLIRMEPGRGYPTHEHLGIEEVLILAGGYRDESGTHAAGSYLRYPAGSRHAPLALGDSSRPAGETNPACVLFAVARGGTLVLDGPPVRSETGRLPVRDPELRA